MTMLLALLPLAAQNDYYIKQSQQYQREAERSRDTARDYMRKADNALKRAR